MVLSFQLLFYICLFCLPLCNIPSFLKHLNPPAYVRLGMYSDISISNVFMQSLTNCPYKGIFILVLCSLSKINSYRAWLYETFWIAVQGETGRLLLIRWHFLLLVETEAIFYINSHLKAFGFFEVLPSTPVLWKAVWGQIGLFHSSAQNVWRSDPDFRAWAAEGNMVLRYCIFYVICQGSLVRSSW